MEFDISDQTEATAMVAIQGPKVIDRLADLLPGRSAGDETLPRSHPTA